MFSDSHLAQDGFLLKHVKRNKEGYVSLKLLTCLKKVKRKILCAFYGVCIPSAVLKIQKKGKYSSGGSCLSQIKVLTTDWYMTLAGAEYSQLLEVNEECTKVRRKETLPKWLLLSPTSKLLLVLDISEEKTEEDGAASGLEHPRLSERIFQKFSAYGNITSMWILYPGKELPTELQKYAKHHRELGQNLCAVVKFEHLEAVRKACSALTAEKSDGEGMHVVPLGLQPMSHIPKEENNQGPRRDEHPHQTSPNSAQKKSSFTVQVSENVNITQPQENNFIQQTPEQIPPSCKSQACALKQWCDRAGLNAGDWCRGTSHCPWVLRRKLQAGGDRNEQRFKAIVLREPLGPDETNGFLCRVK